MKAIYLVLLAGMMMNTVNADEQSEKTLAVAQYFLAAAGGGDATKLGELMSDDFVWHSK